MNLLQAHVDKFFHQNSQTATSEEQIQAHAQLQAQIQSVIAANNNQEIMTEKVQDAIDEYLKNINNWKNLSTCPVDPVYVLLWRFHDKQTKKKKKKFQEASKTPCLCLNGVFYLTMRFKLCAHIPRKYSYVHQNRKPLPRTMYTNLHSSTMLFLNSFAVYQIQLPIQIFCISRFMCYIYKLRKKITHEGRANVFISNI